jgi:tRNA/tmRNA/rRNA uracil-C5-methylase (TrmA/RlmC/RlmD family)
MKRYRDALAEFKARFEQQDGGDASSSKAAASVVSEDERRKKRAKKKRKTASDSFKTSTTISVDPAQDPYAIDWQKKPKAQKSLCGKKKKKALRNRDPSVKYLTNPQNAPKVHAAKEFFSNHWKAGTFNVVCGKKTGWRTVAKLSVRGTPPVIGLFAPNSHRVVPIPDSPAHHPAINKALALLEQAISSVELKGYDGVNPGGLSYVAFSVQRSTSKVQCTLVFNDANKSRIGGDKVQRLVDILGGSKRKAGAPKTQFHSIWLHFHPATRHDNSIFARDDSAWECVYGTDSGVEEFFPNMSKVKPVPKLYFPPYVFRQANLDGFANIVRVIRNFLPTDHKKKVVELYGGVGTIGLNILDRVTSLSCSDENPHNEACFLRSLKAIRDGTKATYTTGSATAMVHQGDLDGKDVCIVDPPRKGMDSPVLDALLRPAGPKRLIYVSCGFKAFQRDFAVLTSVDSSYHYDLIHAEGHILFPGADHLETVAVFDKHGTAPW